MIMLKEVGVDPVPNYTRDIKKGIARWDAYLHVPVPDAQPAEFSSRNVEFCRPLEDNDDGLRGFEVKDADGYMLYFGVSCLRDFVHGPRGASRRRAPMIDCGRRLLVAAAGVLVFAAAAAAGPLQDDLTAGGPACLIERLGPNALAIFWSAEPKVYPLDTDYEFRQDSDMLYLTGIAQEGAILVLMPGNRTQKEVLFIREPNPRREHWNGHSLTKEEAAAESGIKKVLDYAGEFEQLR